MAGKPAKDESKDVNESEQKDVAPGNDTVEKELSPAAIAERSMPQVPSEVKLPERTAYSED